MVEEMEQEGYVKTQLELTTEQIKDLSSQIESKCKNMFDLECSLT